MRSRLYKTRQALVGQIDRLFIGKKEIGGDVLEELEEVLITSDFGVDTTQKLIASMELRLHRRELTDADRLRIHLRDEIHRFLMVEAPALDVTGPKPFVIMAIGVNGVGKTTLLRTIMGLLRPWEGSITFEGNDVSNSPAFSRNSAASFSVVITAPSATKATSLKRSC